MRGNVILLVGSVIAFIASSVSFCVGIGLSFSHEGWGENQSGLAGTNVTLLTVSAILMTIAIVMFWVGLHRLANPTGGPH